MARPSFKPNAVQRRKVAAAAAGGMAQERIALALGISVPTLKKHFATELGAGAALKKIEALDALYRQAIRGNVAACKAVLAIEAARVPGDAPKPAGDAPAPEPKPVRLGKKEIAQLEAGSAEQGTEWAGLLKPSAPLQ